MKKTTRMTSEGIVVITYLCLSKLTIGTEQTVVKSRESTGSFIVSVCCCLSTACFTVSVNE